MPFKSKKQRTWMQINKPEIYKKWKKEHGTKVKPSSTKKKSSK